MRLFGIFGYQWARLEATIAGSLGSKPELSNSRFFYTHPAITPKTEK
jgi:hypothetical protein